MKSTRETSTRPDWRDPDMPVYRNYMMYGGRRIEYVDPEYEQRYREHIMNSPHLLPDWRNDPTYNMRSKHVELPKKKTLDV